MRPNAVACVGQYGSLILQVCTPVHGVHAIQCLISTHLAIRGHNRCQRLLLNSICQELGGEEPFMLTFSLHIITCFFHAPLVSFKPPTHLAKSAAIPNSLRKKHHLTFLIGYELDDYAGPGNRDLHPRNSANMGRRNIPQSFDSTLR